MEKERIYLQKGQRKGIIAPNTYFGELLFLEVKDKRKQKMNLGEEGSWTLRQRRGGKEREVGVGNRPRYLSNGNPPP